jgi:tetratricopeptide (TPR) repeat protein
VIDYRLNNMNNTHKAILFGIFAMASTFANANLDACSKGVRLVKQGEHTAALAEYSTCIATPQIPIDVKARALRNKAGAHAELQQFDNALTHQLEAISLEPPKRAWPLISLAIYYRKVGKLNLSLDAAKAAEKLDEDGEGTGPGMAVYYHMGQTLHKMGRLDEAIEAYTLGIPKQLDYGYALYRRALAYEAKGDKVGAKRDLNRALALEPSYGYEKDIAEKMGEYELKVRKTLPTSAD